MLQRVNTKGKLDIIGSIASVACAVHCSIIPLMLAMGSLSFLSWTQGHWVEVMFLCSAIGLSVLSIIPDYLRDRQQKLPLVLMFAGLSLLIISFAMHSHDGQIQLLSIAGGLSLSAAHMVNFISRRNRHATA